ncbi:MAG: HEAT repeat domain-containing protein [Halorientalis sp.]
MTSVPAGPVSLVATGVIAALVGVAAVTIGQSVRLARRDRRRESARDDLRRELLTRLARGDDADWAAWVAGFDATDRAVVEDILKTFLDRLRGPDRRHLRDLGQALGLGERARRKLLEGDRFDRLEALTWVALLAVPVDATTLREHCGGDRHGRAAAARVLHEQGHPEATAIGTDLLLSSGEALSTLGLDTLYRLNRDDPTTLVAAATDHATDWDNPLLIQVLRVVGACGPSDPDASLTWIPVLFVEDSARVRAAAARALEGYGWRPEVRTAADLDLLCDDDAPTVRRAAYRMLGAWGTEDARERLRNALADDPNARARLVAARELYRLSGERPTVEEWHGPGRPVSLAFRWVEANEAIRS